MLFVEEKIDETDMDISKVHPDLFSFAVYDEDVGHTCIFHATYDQLCDIHKYLGELISERD